jgi:putative transposase
LDEPKRKKTPFQRSVAVDGELRTFKVLMLPTSQQKIELKRCFAVARHAYNFANARVRNDKVVPNAIQLRTEWRKRPLLPWANTPETAVASRIAAGAIKQLADAYKTNYAKTKKNTKHRFVVKYRSLKKTLTEVIIIEKDGPLLRFEEAVSTHKFRAECLAFFGNNLKYAGGIRLQDSQRVVDMMVSEGTRMLENGKIMWDKRTGKFHFIYAYVLPKLEDPDPTFRSKRVVATDPGISPFQEWYSPTSGRYGELLQGAKPRLLEKCRAMDLLQSRIEKRDNNNPIPTLRHRYEMDAEHQRKAYKATTKRLEKKLAKNRRNLHDWVENAHYDAANFLLQEHDIIIQPVLQVSKLVPKEARLLNSKTVRSMCTWSHYKFRERLKSAAFRYDGRHVFETNEPGTSKTCTNCGFWNVSLRLGDKVFNCPKCKIQVDRQLAGARNNFFSAYGQAIGMGWDGVGG